MDEGDLAQLIGAVRVLSLAPTDALVVYPSYRLSEEEASAMADALHTLFPETKILITEHDLAVLREEDAARVVEAVEEGEGIAPGDRAEVVGDMDGDPADGGGI